MDNQSKKTTRKNSSGKSGNRQQHLKMLKIYCDAIEHGLSKQVEIREYAKKHFSGGVSPRSLTKIRRVLSFWRLSEKDAVPVLKKLIANDVTLYEADREALKSIKNFERYFLNVVDGLGAV